MIVRLVVAAALLAACGGFAVWWRRREGRVVAADGAFSRVDLGIAPEERLASVLVEFSGESCAPCRTVEARLEKVAADLPDVRIATIDAGQRLDLADRYQVRRVPTVFVTDSDLRVIWRASGVPTEEALRRALLGPGWAGRPQPRAGEAERPRGLRSRSPARRPRRARRRAPAHPPA